jgi:hypothetical protein
LGSFGFTGSFTFFGGWGFLTFVLGFGGGLGFWEELPIEWFDFAVTLMGNGTTITIEMIIRDKISFFIILVLLQQI